MKIKDLPQDKGLGGVVFLHPETGKRCIWKSQWQKGVWYKENRDTDEVKPLFLDDLKDALELEVAP